MLDIAGFAPHRRPEILLHEFIRHSFTYLLVIRTFGIMTDVASEQPNLIF